MHGQHQAGSLPSRVYERHGVRIYSIGYKRPNGTRAFRLSCHISDRKKSLHFERKQYIELQGINKTAYTAKRSLPLPSTGSTGKRPCHRTQQKNGPIAH